MIFVFLISLSFFTLSAPSSNEKSEKSNEHRKDVIKAQNVANTNLKGSPKVSIYWIVFASIGGVIIIVALVISICACCKRTYQKVGASPGPIQNGDNGNAFNEFDRQNFQRQYNWHQQQMIQQNMQSQLQQQQMQYYTQPYNYNP